MDWGALRRRDTKVEFVGGKPFVRSPGEDVGSPEEWVGSSEEEWGSTGEEVGSPEEEESTGA